MAINKNHEFEELDGVKCGIVERNASSERVAFLRTILEYNGYDVKVIPTPVKAAPAKPVAEGETPPEPAEPVAPTSFTIGVTDYTFNPINAIFGRLLKDKQGNAITLAYWRQQVEQNDDSVPYYATGN